MGRGPDSNDIQKYRPIAIILTCSSFLGFRDVLKLVVRFADL